MSWKASATCHAAKKHRSTALPIPIYVSSLPQRLPLAVCTAIRFSTNPPYPKNTLDSRTVSATEAGAPGRDTRGLYRVHQFTKVEMFAFCTPDQSEDIHLELLAVEEEIFQGLGLPYHVIDTCTGDLGGPAYRKYDLEAWMPGRGESGEYGEVTSTSNCTDFQARRLKIRYKSPQQKGTRFAHTLNGTAVATTRAILGHFGKLSTRRWFRVNT